MRLDSRGSFHLPTSSSLQFPHFYLVVHHRTHPRRTNPGRKCNVSMIKCCAFSIIGPQSIPTSISRWPSISQAPTPPAKRTTVQCEASNNDLSQSSMSTSPVSPRGACYFGRIGLPASVLVDNAQTTTTTQAENFAGIHQISGQFLLGVAFFWRIRIIRNARLQLNLYLTTRVLGLKARDGHQSKAFNRREPASCRVQRVTIASKLNPS